MDSYTAWLDVIVYGILGFALIMSGAVVVISYINDYFNRDISGRVKWNQDLGICSVLIIIGWWFGGHCVWGAVRALKYLSEGW